MTTDCEQPDVNNPEPPTAPPLLISAPIDIRSTSLALIAFIALIGFLYWARAVLIPITLAVLLSYALTPVVEWLKKNAKLHKALGAGLTLIAMVGMLGIGLTSLKPEALNVLDILPRATEKFRNAIVGNSRNTPGAVAKIQKAASEIEKAANATSSTAGATIAPTKPPAEGPSINIRNYLFVGTVGLVIGLGQFAVVIALVYFLLVAGDSFRRTLLQISEGTLSRKKLTVRLLNEIDVQIQRYLLVQIATSALLGLVAWAVFAWIGLEHSLMWGCIAGLLHLVPYAGPASFIALIVLVAYVQFETLQPVFTILGSMVVANGLIGLLFTPWLTQKIGSLNAITVFVALLFWGWLWGIWGLLLGVPIMMAIKEVCDHVQDLQPIGAFLGHGMMKTEADNQKTTAVASVTPT